MPFGKEQLGDQNDKLQDWTGKFNRRKPGEDTRQLSTDTHCKGLLGGGGGGRIINGINSINKWNY